MAKLLEDGECVRKLADKLIEGIQKLSRRTSKPDISNEKFFQTDNQLAYGELRSFFDGLEGIVGPPSVSLWEAIEREHCASSDSHDDFTAPNYGVRTSSCIEYHFVHFGAEGLEVLKKDHPKAMRLLVASTKDGRNVYAYPAEDPDKLKSGDSDAVSAAKPRTPLSYTDIEPKLMGKNDELVQLGSEPMGKEEFLSARMYTGPVRARQQHMARAVYRLHCGRRERRERRSAARATCVASILSQPDVCFRAQRPHSLTRPDVREIQRGLTRAGWRCQQVESCRQLRSHAVTSKEQAK